MKRTNSENSCIYGKGKFYGLNSLYNKRNKLIGDIIIPYKITEENYTIFKDYLKTNFSKKIVIKRDFSCAGQGVYVIDTENFDSKQSDKFNMAMKSKDIHYKGLYVTPYYEFEEEYRFYFTKHSDKIKIYSFKKKKIISSIQDIIQADTFQYYKNVKIKWEYIEKKHWKEYKKIFNLASKYLKKLEYSTGTLEFGKTIDGKIIFFEVNPMSATLCYSGEDEESMNNYYLGIYDNLLENS